MSESGKRRHDDAEREKYWNEDYVRYWKARVDEANKSGVDTSSLIAGDSKASTDRLYVDAIGFLQLSKGDEVLELGCGFGRSLPVLCRAARHVTAVDISKEMIRAARESCEEKNASFHVSPSEALPFADDSFDAVVCFAAFDAMYQSEALREMNRVSRLGARVLITGKNDDYFDDDSAALAAEAGARAKKHPNYFTDVNLLARNLDKFGFRIQAQKYFLRRGDFARDIATTERPERFYEYLFVLKKTGACSAGDDLVISSEISKAYARHESVKQE